MRRQRRKGGGRQHEVTIDSVGGRGDGQVKLADGTSLFVPLTLPGEKVRVREVSSTGAGTICELLELLEPSSDRVEAPCPHFGVCGGCQLQHWSSDAYSAWKHGKALEAVNRAGFDPGCVTDPVQAFGEQGNGPANRRRARFALFRGKDDIQIGFRGRASADLEPLTSCLVLAPELMPFLEALKPWLRQAVDFGESAQLNVNLLTNPDQEKIQADISLIAADEPSARALQSAHVLHDLPDDLPVSLQRVTWEYAKDYATPVVVMETPVHDVDGIKIPVPHDVFLQPGVEGEKILVDLVLDSVPADGLKIADLFAGIGTFAIPLALRTGATVKAYEGFKFALQALKAAQNNPLYSKKLKDISFEQRDLARWALQAATLDGFDMLVLDPPRAGAKALCQEIARSNVKHVTYVSCNPQTFARDARFLNEGGYNLQKLTPVDQFPWTGHLEMVGVFVKG